VNAAIARLALSKENRKTGMGNEKSKQWLNNNSSKGRGDWEGLKTKPEMKGKAGKPANGWGWGNITPKTGER